MTQRLTPIPVLADLVAAAALLTRLPLPVLPASADRTAAAAWCYPLIGAGVGLVAGIAAWAGTMAGMPAEVSAAAAVAAAILLTGALHEDGLADCADGLWGGGSPERRLEIMKDSRSGAYGVTALCVSLLFRWGALVALIDQSPAAAVAALVASGALSRAAMAAVWTGLPPARPDGLARGYGRPPRWSAISGAGLAVVLAGFCVGPGTALLGALAAAAAAGWIARLALRRIGGQTGDVLGAAQQLAEIAVLVCLSARPG